jgi:hypothetical protein
MKSVKTFRWLIWLSVALIGISIALIFGLPYLGSVGLITLEFKTSTNFWGMIWVWSFIGIPAGLIGFYIFGLIEWGLWKQYREQLGYVKSFVPQYVLEYLSSLVVSGLVAVGIYAVMIEIGYEYGFWGRVVWRVWNMAILAPSVFVVPLTVIILWVIPHKDKWRLFATLVIAVNLSASFMYGVVKQLPNVESFLSMTEEERLEKYRPFEVVKEEVVEFDPPMSTERWERYVEALEWTVFDDELESVSITIVNGEGDILAEVDVREDLEYVRGEYRKAMKAMGRDDEWYDARIGSMRVVGTQFRPVFREIDREGGFEEVVFE